MSRWVESLWYTLYEQWEQGNYGVHIANRYHEFGFEQKYALRFYTTDFIHEDIV